MFWALKGCSYFSEIGLLLIGSAFDLSDFSIGTTITHITSGNDNLHHTSLKIND